MKKGVILGFFVALLAAGQERPPIEAVTVTDSVQPANLGRNTGAYVPSDVKVLGILDYGKTQTAVDAVAKQRYRAFIFSGYGGDRVQIALKGQHAGVPFVVTDSTLNKIGSGNSIVTVALPFRGPDIEVYYIVFPTSYKSSPLSVQVRKVGRDMSVPMLVEPRLITEMQTTGTESHKQGGF